jgi:hypothetical protein
MMVAFFSCLGVILVYYAVVVAGTLRRERDRRKGMGRNFYGDPGDS